VEFTLYYRGPLSAKRKGNALEKHNLRRHFHRQLKELWNQPPLNQHFDLIDPKFEPPPDPRTRAIVVAGGKKPDLKEEVGAYTYTSVVSEKIALVADLTITFLRPGPPGGLRDKYGDLDNRIKNLLDGLKIPNDKNVLKNVSTEGDPDPLYCLLEDDSLITRLDIKSDRLLEPDVEDDEVVLLIHVRTRPTIGTVDNLGLM
jgi:hypothetical protein